MEMSRPMPNFATIQGHRVMFEYRGMRRVCARCGEDGHMATACSSPYCKRCGAFGHETEGCEEECKRCGGRHGTRECFRRRSYVAAGFPPINDNAPNREQVRQPSSPEAVASTSVLQVLKPRSTPAATRAPSYWDGEGADESDATGTATVLAASRGDTRESEGDTPSAATDSENTGSSESSSAQSSSNTSPTPHPSGEEQQVPTFGETLEQDVRKPRKGQASINSEQPGESNPVTDHDDSRPIVSCGRYAVCNTKRMLDKEAPSCDIDKDQPARIVEVLTLKQLSAEEKRRIYDLKLGKMKQRRSHPREVHDFEWKRKWGVLPTKQRLHHRMFVPNARCPNGPFLKSQRRACPWRARARHYGKKERRRVASPSPCRLRPIRCPVCWLAD
ncbi:hypothetical protein HPB50_029326 [Hyalomma asiaticum]|nr:hypothetical protein HPB50_029326 [Hyalomma asiaticum]